MGDEAPLPGTFAEFHARLGGIPLNRIWMTPPPGTATEADLFTSWTTPPHHRPELVDGTLVEKSGSFWGGVIVGSIIGHVGRFVEDHSLGVCLMGNLPFRLRPDLIRVPSFSFTPWDRFPNAEPPDEEIASFVPALIVEVPNETNTASELERKVAEYFAAGCKLAWIIDPHTKTAKAYTSAKKFKEIDETGTLDGGKVLPGFTLALTDLFAATKRKKKKPR
jgi:Uma2 family endonuclease